MNSQIQTSILADNDKPLDDPEPEKKSGRTGRMDRAIAYFCRDGYRAELSSHPRYHFTHVQTGKKVSYHINTLLSKYDQKRKEEARDRARMRKMGMDV